MMKKIIYTRPDGGVSVVSPVEGARLAHSITLEDGKILTSAEAQPADRFLRQWPVAGAVAVWAETEDEFIERIRPRLVPANAANAQIVDATAIPADRFKRNAWRQKGYAIEIDPVIAAQIDGELVRLSVDENERQACGFDSAIMALVNQTKAEWLSWAGANFPSLTPAERTRLGNLFWIVAIGVRRSLRAAAP